MSGPLSKKQQKKMRQAMVRKGDKFVPGPYKPDAENEAAARQRRLNRAESLATPIDCGIASIRMKRDMFHGLMDGSLLPVKKCFSEEVVRAVWFNDLDKFHSFNSRTSKIARANSQLVFYMITHPEIDHKDIEPPLLVPFALACLECRIAESKFLDRENFLKVWKATPEDQDLLRFSRKEYKQFSQLTRDLRNALPPLSEIDASIEGEESLTAIAQDLKAALSDAINQELDDEGEELAEKALVGDETKGSHAVGMDMDDYTYYNRSEMKKLTAQGESRVRSAHQSFVKLSLECLEFEIKEEIEKKNVARLLLIKARMLGLLQDKLFRHVAVELGFEGFE